jgi:hypothetical protein
MSARAGLKNLPDTRSPSGIMSGDNSSGVIPGEHRTQTGCDAREGDPGTGRVGRSWIPFPSGAARMSKLDPSGSSGRE